MHICGAKFEEHCSNISRDIDDWVLYCFSGTIYDVITFLICIIQKRKYLYNEKRYSKKENAILFYFEKPFKKAAIIFYFIGTLISTFLFRKPLQYGHTVNTVRFLLPGGAWINRVPL